jgi:phosphoglycerate kinase
MEKLSIRDLRLKGQRVLCRVDFNVPIENGAVGDDTRIRASLPTIRYAIEQGARLVLMSHLGRPKGKDPSLSLAPCAKRLKELLGGTIPVHFAADCIGPVAVEAVQSLKNGEVLLLENLRFYPGEEEPEKHPAFVESLASLGEIYVNDAFGTAHRAHASTCAIARFFPKKAAAGLLLQEEIAHLSPLLHSPPRPFYGLIGGAKVSTKAGVIENLLPKLDGLFVGGGMAFTFLRALGRPTGDSLVEEREVERARGLLKRSQTIHLPLDYVAASAFSPEASRKVVSATEGIPPGWRGMDIGPQTVTAWSQELLKGKTVFWNGPMGVFEMPPFAEGTFALAKALASSKGQVIVGGGDSVAAIQQTGLAPRFSFLSTGGGASLELLEFGHLPGIDALSDK